MSLPSRAYITELQRVVADFVRNSEGDSLEFDTIVTRVHDRVRPGKQKPSLSHKKWTFDALIYEVNTYRLSVTDEEDPQLVTITPTGSAYYFDLLTSNPVHKRRVTKKDAVAEYLAAAAVLGPIRDAIVAHAWADPLMHCVETFPELILKNLELEARLREQNVALMREEQDLSLELDLMHENFLR